MLSKLVLMDVYMIAGKENKEPDGFERKEIRFLVVLRPDGDFVRIDDIRNLAEKAAEFAGPTEESAFSACCPRSR